MSLLWCFIFVRFLKAKTLPDFLDLDLVLFISSFLVWICVGSIVKLDYLYSFCKVNAESAHDIHFFFSHSVCDYSLRHAPSVCEKKTRCVISEQRVWSGLLLKSTTEGLGSTCRAWVAVALGRTRRLFLFCGIYLFSHCFTMSNYIS